MMTANNLKQKKIKPPKLLRGLFTIILITISLILVTAWSIINYDVEKLVATRTSEYAHSIATIAANSSADALLSEDKLQLKMMVENVAKDPYIKTATIFAEDGQVFAQYPEINQHHSQPGEITKTLAYLESSNNIPYVEPIIYQGVTAGWFKVIINRDKLERSFRHSLSSSKNTILVVSFLLLLCLFSIIIRFERKVKTLVAFNHRLIQINSPTLPINHADWMNKIRELSETQFYQLTENKRLPTPEAPWIMSKRLNQTLFCYCQFSMQEQENEQTAACLTQAEHYLQAAIQAHGLHSQGDILSGCLIPLLDNIDRKEALAEVIGLTHLIKELLASLQLPIKIRAFIGCGSILVLENNRAEISGVSLSNRLTDKINKLSPQTAFDDIICINFGAEELRPQGVFKIFKNHLDIPAFKLCQVSKSIQQHVNRQQSYIRVNKLLE